MTAVEINRLNALGAERISLLVKAMFGPEYYAMAYTFRRRASGGNRFIGKHTPGTLMIDVAPRRATWVEALDAARAHFGWTREAMTADMRPRFEAFAQQREAK